MKRKIRIYFVFMFVVVLIGLIISTINIKVFADAGENDIILEVDVNDPPNLSAIISRAQIQATAGISDYTNSIVCVFSDGYFTDVLNQECVSLRKLGDYNMYLQAENSSGQRSYLELTVRVVDKVAPVFLSQYCKSSITVNVDEIDNTMTNLRAYILKNVKARDAHDVFDLTYNVDVSDVERKKGSYDVVVRASDKSGNASNFNMQINILDDKKAGIVFADGHDYMIAEVNDNITMSIVTGYANPVAFDENQHVVSVICNYSDNMEFNEVGMYEIIYSASVGNSTLKATFYLEIIDSEIEFTYDEKLLVAKKDVLFTYEDISSMIRLYASKSVDTYDVVEDEYSENFDKVGEYPYVVHLTYVDGCEEDLKLKFKVVDESKVEEETEEVKEEIKKPNFFEKVWIFLKKSVIILYKILKWPFTLIK